MVFSRRALADKESTSRDAINKSAFYLQIILANSKETFKVNSLEIACRNKGTKTFCRFISTCIESRQNRS